MQEFSNKTMHITQIYSEIIEIAFFIFKTFTLKERLKGANFCDYFLQRATYGDLCTTKLNKICQKYDIKTQINFSVNFNILIFALQVGDFSL